MKRSITIAIGLALALGIIIIGGIRIIKANTLAPALPAESRVGLLKENRLEVRQLSSLDQLDQRRLPATLNANALNSLGGLNRLENNSAHSPRVLGDRLGGSLLVDLS